MTFKLDIVILNWINPFFVWNTEYILNEEAATIVR